MTRNTSSPSAKGTRKTVAVLDTSGTPPTETAYATTLLDMEAARGAESVRMSDLRYATWHSWGRFKHLFRIHTFVPLEVWDPVHGSMQYIGRICWHCPEQTA